MRYDIATSIGAVAFWRAGEGPPVILLHGNGHSHHEFADVLPLLDGRFESIAWDMPGHGASAAVDAALSIERRADILAEGLAALGIGHALIAGASIGAFVAVALADRHPRHVAGLLLSECQLRSREYWEAARPQIEAMFGTVEQARETVSARLRAPPDDSLLLRWNADRAAAGAPAMLAAMDAIRDYDLARALRRVRVPLAALFGEAGPAAETRDALAAVCPSARTAVVANAGHFISIDQPAAFAAAIVALAKEAGLS